MIFEFYEWNYVEKVYLKLNLSQSTKKDQKMHKLLQVWGEGFLCTQ